MAGSGIDPRFSRLELFKCGPQPIYSGRSLDEVAFPLGGIGTGSISLGGWGQLRDWEVMNRPAKGFVVPMAFFTLRIERAGSGGSPIVRVLQGPVGGSYVGDGHSLVPSWRERYLGEGLPRFRNVSFTGHFPFATVHLNDPDVPVDVTLEAFSPFIPLNDKDSSIPVAILRYQLKNLSGEAVKATIFGNLTNVVGYPEREGRVNLVREAEGLRGLYLTTERFDENSPRYGSMVLATTCPEAKVRPRWREDSIAKFWEAVLLGELPSKGDRRSDTGTVAAYLNLDPYGEAAVNFIITWYFPIFEHYWESGYGGRGSRWRNYYATLWSDAWDVALYVASNLERLRAETKLFHDTLFSSTLPIHVLDAVSSQLSTLRTNTCLRLEDGTFYGFEGCSDSSGCCEGSCTHVWLYAQALPYLFPKLQRSMVDAHLSNSVMEDGFMAFRMPLPLGTKAKPIYHPAADGQMGIVLQVYRDWLITGDEEWLRSVWPKVKRILEYAWKYWDSDRDGVMEGMQHNTYDVEFYGPNTMTGSLYLAALRAAEEIALHLGKADKAEEYHRIFEAGSKWTDENLFNGEYYGQKVNPKAYEIWPEPFKSLALKHGWDDKFDWPKWQFGSGCLSNQLIGQWYSHMLGLGYLYNPENIRKALRSIYKYNWKSNLWDHPCLYRVYAVNGEAGLIICTWPRGGRPGYALYYADEVWCGVEYQVASHMIYEDMVEEGLTIAMGVRLRHRGDRRNPWDEFECGHHYARSMASYALLLALSGFRYSAPEKTIRFSPRIFREEFRVFFSTGSGWGLYSQTMNRDRAEFTLDLRYGSLRIKRLELPPLDFETSKVWVTLNEEAIAAELEADRDVTVVTLNSDLLMEKGHRLRISVYGREPPSSPSSTT